MFYFLNFQENETILTEQISFSHLKRRQVFSIIQAFRIILSVVCEIAVLSLDKTNYL